MVKKLGKHHYLATQTPQYPESLHRGYSTDGEDSQRAASDRTMSEYTVTNERARVMPPPRRHRSKSRERERRSRSEERQQYTDQEGSDIYVTSAAYRAPSEISRGSRYSRHSRNTPSHYSYRAPSEVSTIKTKVDHKRGLVIETMSAPNPFCPHTRGMCCLMLLLNLGLILVTLGIVIVVQFFQPVFVWILGIVFLIFGFLTLVGSLIYCVAICRDAKTPAQVAAEDHHWTRHWSGNIGSPPEIHYRADDKYSDRY
ncbi:uncharacterized protein LOC124353498 isoform X2 [Homalodisca vitripennis]|uniref:uncharacterized protein LOC124353498 isoform X1 n=2 Tax=Homalodisca vitripennis TaxID=197043 RepID=UPI001EE9BF3A|nr:uncharacterized protein LOC124353498 isoform X1 [Homalodisca vitripennis]XP_046659317.1 uncharacterized protein LOC124353498 isoform X2 [Homalodisca vitripennis]